MVLVKGTIHGLEGNQEKTNSQNVPGIYVNVPGKVACKKIETGANINCSNGTNTWTSENTEKLSDIMKKKWATQSTNISVFTEEVTPNHPQVLRDAFKKLNNIAQLRKFSNKDSNFVFAVSSEVLSLIILICLKSSHNMSKGKMVFCATAIASVSTIGYYELKQQKNE